MVKAVDYLLNVNRGYRMDLGRRVVVIGGGFVAFDAARTALRASAREGHRRGADRAGRGRRPVQEALDSARAAMRGGAARRDHRVARGLRRDAGPADDAGPRGVRGGKRKASACSPPRAQAFPRRRARLEAIELRAVASVFDAEGRFAPVYDDGDVDRARGRRLHPRHRPARRPLVPQAGGRRRADAGGHDQVDPQTLATSAPGVFAGGDVAFGPRNLIEAVANGKRARARSTSTSRADDRALERPFSRSRTLPTRDYRMRPGFELLDREAPPTLDVGRRTGIAEVETGYDAEAGAAAGARCLVCHVQTIYDPEKCVLCNRCVDVCPEYCLAIVPFEALDLDDDAQRALAERAAANGCRSPRWSRTTTAASAAGCARSAAPPTR